VRCHSHCATERAREKADRQEALFRHLLERHITVEIGAEDFRGAAQLPIEPRLNGSYTTCWVTIDGGSRSALQTCELSTLRVVTRPAARRLVELSALTTIVTVIPAPTRRVLEAPMLHLS
jgi:hypothetical protein